MSDKTKWTTPQLIVLARGTPEEAVLTACKAIVNTGTNQTGTGMNNVTQNGCNRDSGGDDGKNCGTCQDRGSKS